MNFFGTFIVVLQLINIIFALVLIFVERRNAATTWAWLLFLFVFPGIGLLAYLLLGQNLSNTRLFSQKRLNDILIKKHELKVISPEYNFEGTPGTMKIINFIKKSSDSPLYEDNSMEIFSRGEDKFSALMDDMRKAKSFIHVQYFIIKPDTLGEEILEILTAKAKEGLEVRILADAAGSKFLSKKYFKNFKEAGGKISFFFPSLIPFLNIRLNYRNHRKIVVIDGEIGYIGGFNIGNEYLGQNKFFGHWRDAHLRIRGSAVMELEERFLLDYGYATHDNYELKENYFPQISRGVGTPIQIISDGPDTEEQYIKNAFLKMITSAEKSIYIETPYFIPDDSIKDALKVAANSGVDVKIIIPNKPDHPFVYWASYSYIGELLPSGVRVFTYEKGFIHSKIILVDEEVCSIGTTNIDIRSFKLNFEINAFVYGKEDCYRFVEICEADLRNSKEITKEIYKNRSVKIKFKEAISRLFSPIL